MKRGLLAAVLVFAASTAFAQDVTTAIPVPAGLPSWASTLWAAIVTPAAIGYVVTWIAAIIPQAAPGSVWAVARAILDIVAGNVLNSKNVPKA